MREGTPSEFNGGDEIDPARDGDTEVAAYEGMRRQWRTGTRISPTTQTSGQAPRGSAKRSSVAATGPFVLFSMGQMARSGAS